MTVSVKWRHDMFWFYLKLNFNPQWAKIFNLLCKTFKSITKNGLLITFFSISFFFFSFFCVQIFTPPQTSARARCRAPGAHWLARGSNWTGQRIISCCTHTWPTSPCHCTASPQVRGLTQHHSALLPSAGTLRELQEVKNDILNLF